MQAGYYSYKLLYFAVLCGDGAIRRLLKFEENTKQSSRVFALLWCPTQPSLCNCLLYITLEYFALPIATPAYRVYLQVIRDLQIQVVDGALCLVLLSETYL